MAPSHDRSPRVGADHPDAGPATHPSRTRPERGAWLGELLEVLELRREVLAAAALGLSVAGLAAAWFLPGFVPPRPVVGAAVGLAAVLLSVAIALGVDAADLTVRGARHVRASGAVVAATLSGAATEVGAAPLARVLRDTLARHRRLRIALAPAGADAVPVTEWTDALGRVLARAGTRVLVVDLVGPSDRGQPGISDVVAGEARLGEAVQFDPELTLARIGPGRDPRAALPGLAALAPRLPSDIEVALVALPPLVEAGSLSAVAGLGRLYLLVVDDQTRRVDLIASLDAADRTPVPAEVVLLQPAPEPDLPDPNRQPTTEDEQLPLRAAASPAAVDPDVYTQAHGAPVPVGPREADARPDAQLDDGDAPVPVAHGEAHARLDDGDAPLSVEHGEAENLVAHEDQLAGGEVHDPPDDDQLDDRLDDRRLDEDELEEDEFEDDGLGGEPAAAELSTDSEDGMAPAPPSDGNEGEEPGGVSADAAGPVEPTGELDPLVTTAPIPVIGPAAPQLGAPSGAASVSEHPPDERSPARAPTTALEGPAAHAPADSDGDDSGGTFDRPAAAATLLDLAALEQPAEDQDPPPPATAAPADPPVAPGSHLADPHAGPEEPPVGQPGEDERWQATPPSSGSLRLPAAPFDAEDDPEEPADPEDPLRLAAALQSLADEVWSREDDAR